MRWEWPREEEQREIQASGRGVTDKEWRCVEKRH